MATEIQEPSDLPEGSITPQTEGNYEVLVYQKAADGAGIKKLGIGDWRTYIGYDKNKVTNVANYVGMPSDYHWDDGHEHPYTGTTVTNQIGALADKLGISQEPGTFTPTILERINSLQDSVDGYHTGQTPPSPNTGLLADMAAAKLDITSLKEEVGSSSASGSLTARVDTLEGYVGQEPSGGSQGTGLLKVQYEVEDPITGLIKKVSDIETEIGDGTTSGLRKDVNDNTSAISTINEDLNGDGSTTFGIKGDISALQDTVNGPFTDPSTGLTNRMTTVETTLNGDGTSANPGLVQEVSEIKSAMSSVYSFRGDITNADNDGIYIDGSATVTLYSDLQNGWTYNINPSGDTLPIKGKTYNKGANVAWIVDRNDFDELGMNIDVSQITALDTRISAIESKFFSTSINANVSYDTSTIPSTTFPDGIYQFTLSIKVAMNYTTSVIIAPIGGRVIASPGTALADLITDLTGNATTYWETDTDHHLIVKSVANTRKLSFMKIGEL